MTLGGRKVGSVAAFGMRTPLETMWPTTTTVIAVDIGITTMVKLAKAVDAAIIVVAADEYSQHEREI